MSEAFYQAWRESIGLEPKVADSEALRHTAENIRVTLSINEVVQAETLLRLLDVYDDQINEYCERHEHAPELSQLEKNFDCGARIRNHIGDYLKAHAPQAYQTVKQWFPEPVLLDSTQKTA